MSSLFVFQIKIRKDLIDSVRSIAPKQKPTIQYEKSFLKSMENSRFHSILSFRVERVTRYSLKVQSGEIKPYVPKWQQTKEKQPSKWTLLFKDNPNPYKRVFKPRVRN